MNMWTDKQPVYSDEQQQAQALIDVRSKEYSAASEAYHTIQYAYEQAITEKIEASRKRQQEKYADKIAETRQAVLDAQAAYDAAVNAYNVAQNDERALYNHNRWVLQRVGSLIRTHVLPLYAPQLDAANAALNAAATAYDKAQRDAQYLKYTPGIQLASIDNNNGEAVVAPDGTVFMVPRYEDHGNVYEAVKPRIRTRGGWARIYHGVATDFTDSRNEKSKFTNAQLNALSDFVDMLRDAAKGDLNMADTYTRYADRLYAQINTAQE